MNSTAIRRAAAAAERTPLIKFLGKRVYPPASQIDHTPVAHPMSPNGALPAVRHNSFTTYRSHAQQHGPLHHSLRSGNSVPGSRLGPVAAPAGIFFDRSELPPAYHYTRIDPAEVDAIESGGASLVA
ncbi:hypothetical protein BROUX41_003303 [Berkeleyomyces rouxiae]|uniref:uncharacterized protein n=1 Tax=Berkeleyomyces rouxiae TaxID=2035830 RepID=UPI003B784E3D